MVENKSLKTAIEAMNRVKPTMKVIPSFRTVTSDPEDRYTVKIEKRKLQTNQK